MTKKRKGILFFAGFSIAVAAFLWYRHNKRDVQYEVVYPFEPTQKISYAILGDKGEIVCCDADDPDYAFFIWEQSNGITKINRPEFETSQRNEIWIPQDINIHGHVVGNFEKDKDRQAFLWTSEKDFTFLEGLGGGISYVQAINDNGMVVGTAKTVDGKKHAFLWEEGKGTSDLTPDAQESHAYAINNNGQVVGRLNTPNGYKAFVWEESSGVTILNINGSSKACAYSINDLGQIAGSVIDNNNHAILFTWDKSKGARILNINTESCVPILNNAGCIAITTYSESFSIWNYTITRPKFRFFIGNGNSGFVPLHNLLHKSENLEVIFISHMNNRGEILAENGYGRQVLLRPIKKPD
ncbi:MAG: DUF3466 family protein [Sedimentisphaerales bacterium]|nr:DUF3466 family protein [Sedimentisphaerales bacterium]